MMKQLKTFLRLGLILTFLCGMLTVAPPAVSADPEEDLFIGHNPGLENTSDDGTGGWEAKTIWDCLATHDKSDVYYTDDLGDRYLHIDYDVPGTTLPFFDDLEPGRHYYLSFYVRHAETRSEGTLRVNYLVDGGDYAKTPLDYHWTSMTQNVGITPADEADPLTWTKLTYDVIVPPNANGLSFTLSLNRNTITPASAMDFDNFSLIPGQYLSDNILRNGSFDAIRGDLDPMFWETYNVTTTPYGTPADGNGGYCFQTSKKGYLYQGQVWLEGGKQYKLSYRYNNTALGNVGFGICIGNYASDNRPTFYYGGSDGTYAKGVYHPQANEWETYTAVFTAPGEAGTYAAYTFAVGVGGSQFGGTVLFDDVVLTETENVGIGYYLPLAVVKGGDKRTFMESNVENSVYWQRGASAEAVTDFTADAGNYPVKATGYYFPKAAGESVSMLSAAYKQTENGKKQLIGIQITTATAQGTDPILFSQMLNVAEEDAPQVTVRSFIRTAPGGMQPIAINRLG